MQQLTLQQLFGNSASQDSQQIIISKADLPKLTASAGNTAESLLVALLLKAHANYEGYLSDPAGNRVVDGDRIPVTYRFANYELTDLSYWKRQHFQQNQQAYILDTFLLKTYELYQIE